jgi:hypothetical protein
MFARPEAATAAPMAELARRRPLHAAGHAFRPAADQTPLVRSKHSLLHFHRADEGLVGGSMILYDPPRA